MSFRETTSPRFSSRTRVAIRFGAPLDDDRASSAHQRVGHIGGPPIDDQDGVGALQGEHRLVRHERLHGGEAACGIVRPRADLT